MIQGKHHRESLKKGIVREQKAARENKKRKTKEKTRSSWITRREH